MFKKILPSKTVNEQTNDESIPSNRGDFVACGVQLERCEVASDLLAEGGVDRCYSLRASRITRGSDVQFDSGTVLQTTARPLIWDVRKKNNRLFLA